ncbi:MAG: DNA-processing protein DprA [Kiritimatiellia bacterium]|nr:DNA-processing protein DprA [Kiritimatiellia bacterium]
MNIDFSLSPDTQAVLLLCGALGRNDRELPPLTLGQYNVFATALNTIGKRPGDLIGASGLSDALVGEACAVPNTNGRVKSASPERIAALLRRGVTLSTALDKWASYGVRVVSRADESYPARLRKHLGAKAPALLYYAGNAALLSGGGMAFVGARDITAEATDMLRSVVRGCVDLGMNVVSGGARGADQAAMQEAFSVGGKVIGALPCDLLKACLDPSNRDALAGGNALLFSAFDPEERPFRYGQVAMDRNKYIYGMADACFVAQSGKGTKSGTWSGADEELKNKNRNPIYVYLGKNPSEGCVDLAKRGAVVWDPAKTVAENLAESARAERPVALKQDDLFSGFSAADSVVPYGKVEKPVAKIQAKPAGSDVSDARTPYAIFLDELKDVLAVPHKETETKKRLGNKLDLVTAQVKHWLEKAEKDGIVVRKEYPKGKKTCVMLELGV